MVKISFEQINNKFNLTIKGHAGQADKGNDIVCASCSILAYIVAQFVKEAEYKGDLKSKPKVKMESGDTVISCEPTDNILTEMQNMYLFAEKGYQLLSYNYPQYVELKQFGQPDEA